MRKKRILAEWMPEIVVSIRKHYSLRSFSSDIRAGLLVSVVAFPLFMTFAIASGASPMIGIITSVIAGSLACLCGGSRFQIVGPTGAFAMIVADIIKIHGFEGMTCALIMAGILMIIFALLHIGDLIHYVPYPITAGFTAGIGLSIIVAQLGNFLGLQLQSVPANFFCRLSYYFSRLDTVNGYALALGLFSLIFLEIMQKYRPQFPRYLVILLIGIGYSSFFPNVGLETVGSKFGDIAHNLPVFSVPEQFFSFTNLRKLFPAAFAIAFLGSLESLLGAVISDNLSGQKHRSNMELFGQGVANLGSAVFGGIPATCALGTTSLNVKVGAQTPVAGLCNALLIMLYVFCLGDFIKIIPLSCLAAMLLTTAWNMAALTKNKYIFLAPKSDSSVFILTILTTLLVDIVIAVEVGLIMSAFLFIKRSVETTKIEICSKTIHNIKGKTCECESLKVCGHLFFGAAPILNNALKSLPKTHDIIYIDMQNVPFIDATGAKVLKEFVVEAKEKHIQVIIGGLDNRIRKALRKMDSSGELQGAYSDDVSEEPSAVRGQ
ncbi:MAG: STAS domain-containing protein [Holosporaceae bacterium]|jgi:SulP family sulfate permease|nr:STAS domain-containing protein [Holosporaceae bacterium]